MWNFELPDHIMKSWYSAEILVQIVHNTEYTDNLMGCYIISHGEHKMAEKIKTKLLWSSLMTTQTFGSN
jgi:hypothetical protein